ncbi:IS256 family transposase [Pseudomonadota bacterium]
MTKNKIDTKYSPENSFSDSNSNSNPDFNYETFKKESIKKLYEGKGLSGKDGIFTSMIKDFLETALKEELNIHLQSEKQNNNYLELETEGESIESSNCINNRKNGYTSKNLKTSNGSFELDTPRDRNSTFSPTIVKKNQTILTDELDNKIIALYGLGMSYGDIIKHMVEMYGVQMSKPLISTITDKIIPKIKEWQNRPLESIYPIIFLDAMHFKCNEEAIVKSKAFYTVLGINQSGIKDILGLYVSESEGANFWLSVLTDLQNRGVEDIFIACVDGLKGFPEAINSIFPKTEIQLCIIHQIRNSLKYVASKNQKEFMKDLKEVYRAPNKDIAETNLLKLEEKWGKLYPIVIKSWNNNWHHLSNYFKYPQNIRRMIYTTNIVEGFHRQVRKVTKTKGSFTSQKAFEKLIFLVIQNISKKWMRPIPNWSLTISQLDIYFEDRLNLPLKTTESFGKKKKV